MTDVTVSVGLHQAEYCFHKSCRIFGTARHRSPLTMLEDCSPADVLHLMGESPKFRKRTGSEPELTCEEATKGLVIYWRQQAGVS